MPSLSSFASVLVQSIMHTYINSNGSTSAGARQLVTGSIRQSRGIPKSCSLDLEIDGCPGQTRTRVDRKPSRPKNPRAASYFWHQCVSGFFDIYGGVPPPRPSARADDDVVSAFVGASAFRRRPRSRLSPRAISSGVHPSFWVSVSQVRHGPIHFPFLHLLYHFTLSTASRASSTTPSGRPLRPLPPAPPVLSPGLPAFITFPSTLQNHRRMRIPVRGWTRSYPRPTLAP